MSAPTTTDVPSNIYKPNSPLEAKVVSIQRLTSEDSPNDVQHIVFDIAGSDLKYMEGQSIGILPPGLDASGKPHKLRLYSIASPAVGDDGNGKTVSLCVKRANTTDPETGVVYKGVCSNYLCDLTPGEAAKVTGPVGKAFLMPQALAPELKDSNMIMVATGTGIAPFRGFLHHRYNRLGHEKGQTWLFFGAQTRKDYLYAEELDAYAKNDGCNIVTAFSREEKNPEGGRMYVQHRIMEHRVAIFNMLKQKETYFYMCGLRGMEPGIIEGLQAAAQAEGIDWASFFEQLKAEKRWHVEVY